METDSITMDDEQQSLVSPRETKKEEQVEVISTLLPKTGGANGFFGKHRMAAAITHLQNQINLIQVEELDQLETVGESSIVCKQLIASVESVPDPLLPLTKGPADVNWDHWFGGNHNSKRRWI